MSYMPEPVTRTDKYLAYIAGNMDVILPDHPITRKEYYLAAWAEKSGFEDVDVAGEPPLTLENAIGKPLKGLRIYGKSKQVTTTGAQLFPPPSLGSQEKNGITIDCMEDGKIRISGTAETTVDFYLSRLRLSTGTYTFSAGVNIDTSVLRYTLVTDGGEPYFDVYGDYTTATIAKTIDVSLLLRVYAGKTIDLTVQPMLNASSTPLPWEPYTGGKPSPNPDYPQEIESVGQDMNNIMLSISSTALPHEPQSMFIATPNGLPGIPVSYGDNYTDADGQQWICDEINFTKGVYVQRIAKKLLTSTGEYELMSTVISNKKRILIKDISANTVLPAKTADTIGAVMADFLFAKSANKTYTCKEGISIEITGHISFYAETIQTIEQVQEYFGDNPMTLYYALATPVEIPLTSDQLAAYKQLHTYKGTTIIDNDAGAYMSVRYEKMK